MATYLVLLGPPGAGKGTQAKRLAKRTNLSHVSSGDLFRDNIRQNTPLGEQAKSYLDQGELVPDEVTVSMVEDRLKQPDCGAGAILDGFPRTIAQAEQLERMLAGWGEALSAVYYITVPEAVLVERLTGRLLCKAGGHIYHRLYNPPKEAGVCDIDGSPLFQRDDDREETVRNRIAVYHEQTAPLIEFYRERDLLVDVDGDQPLEAVTEALAETIGELR